MHRHLLRATCAIAALAALLAGCASDDTADSADAATASDAPTTTVELTGDPITIMVIAAKTNSPAPFPEAFDGARAAVESINASGGINGSPLELIECDEKANETESVRCARDAVDGGVTAVVGAFTTNGAPVTVLQEAGVPMIAPMPTALEYFSSPVSFPIQGGPVVLAGIPHALAQAGSTKLGVLGTEGFESSQIADLYIDQGIASADVEKVGPTVLVPFGATDVSSYLAKVTADGVDGVAAPLTSTELSKFLTTAQQQAVDVPFAASSVAVPPATIEELGDAAEGLLLVGSFPPVDDPSEAMQSFRADMEDYAPDALVDEISLNSWLGVQILADVSEGLASVDAASVLAVLNTTSDLETGIVPPLSFDTPYPMEMLSRPFNTTVYLSEVKDGKAELLSPDPIDPLASS